METRGSKYGWVKNTCLNQYSIYVYCICGIRFQYLFGPVETGHSPVLRPSLVKEVPLELQSLPSPQITEKQ